MDPQRLQGHLMGRVRKRPSMLSEFHGKHYNHRDADREMTVPPYLRSQYGNLKPHPPIGTYSRYGPGYHKSDSGMDPRRHPYSHHHPRPNHYPAPSNHQQNAIASDFTTEDTIPIKRPRLFIDVSQRDSVLSEAPNSADSSVSSSCGGLPNTTAPRASILSPTQGPGLSAYLEDINSDDDIQDDEERAKKSPQGQGVPGKQTKEELLQMMDRVDRDIAATESQIAALLKKKAKLEESSKALAELPSIGWVAPVAALLVESPYPDRLSDSNDSIYEEEEDTKVTPKVTLINTIYAENRLKVKSATAALHTLCCASMPPSSLLALYHQPCEIPGYNDIIERHKAFRPKLLQYVQRLKLDHHNQELKLCKEYDRRRVEWEARVQKMEGNQKKRHRDARNKELFERLFPELRTRREQMEKFSRVDQRGVRSDAELKELMYELMEQEEAPVRYRRTQAVVPPMMIDSREQSARFTSNSGLIKDPMALYKESTRIACIWTEEEKKIFREKFLQYPKNFAVIADCLPNKTTADCIKYYYLYKRNEHFKQLISKANIRKRKVLFKPHSISMMPQTPLLISSKQKSVEDLPRSVAMSAEEESTTELQPIPNKSAEQEEWTETEIADLKEGLRKYGKAWGKIYREIGSGSSRTATQCKQFFDNCSHDRLSELHQALAEHSSIKNAEKARRKAENRKQSSLLNDTKGKKPCTVEEYDSENTESASESEMCSVDSESESTITDSSPEEPVPLQAPRSPTPSKDSHPHEKHPLEAVITAAEMLMENKNSISVEVALHDHNYALPSAHQLNAADIQGTSGLSLIAAAAAVVSPSLSRGNGNTSKVSAVSPVKAPRGRPPSSQKRSGGHYANKLAPNLLSPAGSSSYVPLTDGKTSMRSRTKSAPVERPKLPLQCRSPSGVPRNSAHSRAGRSTLPSAYSKPSKLHPNSTDLETLVNVALASSPVEMPKSSGASSNAAGYLTLALSGAQPSSVQVQCKEGTTMVDMNHVLWALSNPQFHNLLVQTDLLSKLGGSQYNVMAAPMTGSPHEGQDQQHAFEGRAVVLEEEAKTPLEATPPLAHHVPDTQASPAGPMFVSYPPDPNSTSVGEELSNLNLLSSLVAAVASSQSAVPTTNVNTSSNRVTMEQATGVTLLPQGAGPDVGAAGYAMLGTPKQTPHSSSSSWSVDSVPFCQPDGLTPRLNSLTNSLLPLSTMVPPLFSYPSTSQQQTLLLYTRSLSFPLSSTLEQTVEEDEEEDHLEIASRGINELSMLLGNGSRGDSSHPDSKASALWNATPLPSSISPCIQSRSSLTTSSTSSSDLYFLDPHTPAVYSVLTGFDNSSSSTKEPR